LRLLVDDSHFKLVSLIKTQYPSLSSYQFKRSFFTNLNLCKVFLYLGYARIRSDLWLLLAVAVSGAISVIV
jgi:hypothetical protein